MTRAHEHTNICILVCGRARIKSVLTRCITCLAVQIWWVAPIIGAIASSLLYESFFKHMWSSTLDKIRGPGGEAQPAVSTSTGYP